MKEDLTPEDVVATVLLMRDVDNRVIVLVEGTTDCAVLDSHLDGKAAMSMPAFGHRGVTESIAALRAHGDELVVGVIDRDAYGEHPMDSHVFTTEHADLETDLLFLDGVLRRFLLVSGSRAQTTAFLEECGTADAAVLRFLKAAAPVGALRTLSRENGLDLTMSRFPVEQVFDLEAFEMRRDALVALALARSPHVLTLAGDLSAALEHFLDNRGDPATYVCGHDVASIIGLVCRRLLGAQGLGRDQVERGLRAAVGCREFALLLVARELSAWAAARSVVIWDHTAA